MLRRAQSGTPRNDEHTLVYLHSYFCGGYDLFERLYGVINIIVGCVFAEREADGLAGRVGVDAFEYVRAFF